MEDLAWPCYCCQMLRVGRMALKSVEIAHDLVQPLLTVVQL